MAIKRKKGTPTVPVNENGQQVFALDIGSSHLRLAFGIVGDDKQIKIQGLKQCPSQGFVKGHISDIDSLARQIALIVQDFQNQYGVVIENLVTEVPGCFISAENQDGFATIQSGTVTIADRNRAIKNAIAGVKINESEYSIIHAIPQQYTTEDVDLVSNPIGMYAKRLEVNVHVIGCKYIFKKNIEQAIKMTNPDLNVSSLIYAGNAASSAVLRASEKDIGVIHVDIGGGTVNVTVYEGNRQLLSFGINDGGEYITKMIAKEFSISMKNAESLKCTYGCADVRMLTEDAANSSIVIPDTESNTSQVSSKEVTIRTGALVDVINRALRSMFELIFQQIDYYGRETLKSLEIGAGVVLTGGTSKLPGIEQVASEIIKELNYQDNTFIKCNPKVSVGHPIGISVFEDAGSPGFISDSDKAVVIGLLRSAKFDDLKQYTDDELREEREKNRGVVKSVYDWVRRELF
jgi:cell division protein FtsA